MEIAEGRVDSILRAEELARSVLPNTTHSKYIDTRPLLQWKHFFTFETMFMHRIIPV